MNTLKVAYKLGKVTRYFLLFELIFGLITLFVVIPQYLL